MNKLIQNSIVGLFAAGLVSCAKPNHSQEDKNNNREAKPTVFINIVDKKMSIAQLNIENKNLTSSSVFELSSPVENVVVKSVCNVNTKGPVTNVAKFSNVKKIPVMATLPEEYFFNSGGQYLKGLTCQYDLILQPSPEEQFVFSLSNLKISDTDYKIGISDNYRNKSTNPIKRANLINYWVDIVEPEVAENIFLECESFKAKHDKRSRFENRLSSFDIKNRTKKNGFSKEDLKENPIQNCRVFNISGGKLSLASPYFKIRFESPSLNLKTTFVKNLDHKQVRVAHTNLLNITVLNNNNFPIFIKLEKRLNLQFLVYPVKPIHLENPNIKKYPLGYAVKTYNYKINNSPLISKRNENIYKIPKNQKLLITFNGRLSNRCSLVHNGKTVHVPVGYAVRSRNNSTVSLLDPTDFNTVIERKNLIDPKLFWIKFASNTSGNKFNRPPDIDFKKAKNTCN